MQLQTFKRNYRSAESGWLFINFFQEPPFTYCGIHMFGPIVIKEGRKEIKRYGCLFTCLSCRARHIESTNSLSTDAFIQALQSFVSWRDNVQIIRTDNGTNFVGTSGELNKAFSEMKINEKINEFMLEHGSQWIQCKKNPPTASNMRGVWERQIRSARSILVALLKIHGTSPNDESLRTLLAVVRSYWQYKTHHIKILVRFS